MEALIRETEYGEIMVTIASVSEQKLTHLRKLRSARFIG